MRKKIVAANWKMNMTQAESARFVESLLLDLGDITDIEVVIVPPFTAIARVMEALDKAQNIKVGAHEATLRPIVCIGETLDQRDKGNVEKILAIQLRGSLKDLSKKELQETVIAYEPVWAIGTGRNATPGQAQEAHMYIRETLRDMANDATAERVRIQYGGSVKPENAHELMSQPDIDGALVGGASLDPRSFAQIVKAARQD